MMEQPVEKEKRIRIGITHGDVNGIGYEVIIKTLQDQRLMENYTLVVYGSSKVASYHRKVMNVNDFNFNLVKRADQAHPRRANIVNVHDEEVKIDLGKATTVAGELALMSLEAACEDLQKGLIDVVVTAPINKKNIQLPGFDFPGHTEYFARKFNTDDYLMLMINNVLRIGVVTGHMPLARVAEVITTELILKKIEVMNHSLIRDFGIVRPRIAVLALNPHASDEGLLGNEEKTIIQPAIEKAYEQNILVYGPYPADGFFGAASFRKFDGVLAMYHDQGMMPFKLLSFDVGVNFTAGLPIVRTSPAHGTAYDLAGKNEASPEAFRNALYMAGDIFTHRQEYDELIANPLRPSAVPQEQNRG
ncbi:MAG TPA: 4-hydroxythreonine-4-phosphate dehydrogenase PdxA [Bacteroidales bacterium]|nr:4-hydroxythreonine-4-phosphate dehydrogenase PdxA [Bacteroidales bacterium]HPS63280.1 4-hydroxythreonine-4-phosphate dehydrogenase PdxA [Bacteroidales bacterium]